MLIPIYTKQFEKDLRRTIKRGKNIEKFKIPKSSLNEWAHTRIYSNNNLSHDRQSELLIPKAKKAKKSEKEQKKRTDLFQITRLSRIKI